MAETKFAPYNTADYLDNEEVIAMYLAAALEDPDTEAFMMALSNVAKVRGIAKVARDSGLGREGLCEALAPDAKPRFETVRKLVAALGVRWTVAPYVSRMPGNTRGAADMRSRRQAGGR
ncbi:MAG TPA: addiction module antidote protein [Edaphobacter sp.]|nr:addiction module antidote protein [Edaphobacter sp.]HVX90754.1 addiction module antidote protein [Candidatus Paceibacterota bacterium]